MRITDMITRVCLMFYQLLTTTPVGNEEGQQMRIQLLIWGFKGLNRAEFDSHTHFVVLLLEQTAVRRKRPHCHLSPRGRRGTDMTPEGLRRECTWGSRTWGLGGWLAEIPETFRGTNGLSVLSEASILEITTCWSSWADIEAGFPPCVGRGGVFRGPVEILWCMESPDIQSHW